MYALTWPSRAPTQSVASELVTLVKLSLFNYQKFSNSRHFTGSNRGPNHKKEYISSWPQNWAESCDYEKSEMEFLVAW